MGLLSGGVSGVESHGGGGVGLELAGVEPGLQERVVDMCTGGAGVAQESRIELNSGLRAWVFLFTMRWGPPRDLLTAEILDPVLGLILQVMNWARNA